MFIAPCITRKVFQAVTGYKRLVPTGRKLVKRCCHFSRSLRTHATLSVKTVLKRREVKDAEGF